MGSTGYTPEQETAAASAHRRQEMNLTHGGCYKKAWVEGEKLKESSLQWAKVLRISLEGVVS